MNKNRLLIRVYGSSGVIIVSIILAICLLYNWPIVALANAVLASVVISSPALVSLQVLLWLSQKADMEKSFAWMLLLAFIPPLALLVGWLLSGFVPGKTGFLLLLGSLSAYTAVFAHALSVSRFFNTTTNESE
jgi:hypothetical protein